MLRFGVSPGQRVCCYSLNLCGNSGGVISIESQIAAHTRRLPPVNCPLITNLSQETVEHATTPTFPITVNAPQIKHEGRIA
jgi:hypothetical protein